MRNSTEIPEGYKDSPLGVIPKEWLVMRLGDLVDIRSGESPSLFDLGHVGAYPYVKVDDLNNCSKYQRRSREYAKIAVNAVKRGSTIFPKRGAAIMNNKVRLADCDILMDSNMMAIMPNTEYLDEEFLYYRIIYEKLYRIADTSTIPQINNKHIIPYKIPLPSLSEQKRIVNLLNTWDKAIEKQTELIEKLKLRKRGLMQQLLTGKKRLPGFTSKWKTVHISDHFNIVMDKNDGKGHVPMTISAKYGLISQEEKFDRVVAGNSLNNYTLLRSGDFAYNKGNSNLYEMGCIYRLKEKSAIVPFVYICFRVNDNTCCQFFYHFFINHGLDRQLKRIITSGARSDGLLNVSSEDFMKLKIPYPELSEQAAISRIIDQADNELRCATESLRSFQSQKRGLMQQLLTGKKRI